MLDIDASKGATKGGDGGECATPPPPPHPTYQDIVAKIVLLSGEMGKRGGKMKGKGKEEKTKRKK